jgi:hypothetical protein
MLGARIRMGLAVVGLWLLFSAPAKAQWAVGGWSGYGGVAMYGQGYGGYGYAPYGGFSPYGSSVGFYGGYNPYGFGYNAYNSFYYTPPMTVNTMGPLMQTIQRTTGKRYNWNLTR